MSKGNNFEKGDLIPSGKGDLAKYTSALAGRGLALAKAVAVETNVIYRADLQRTGFFKTKPVPQFNKVKWKFEVDFDHDESALFSSPVIAGNMVYFGMLVFEDFGRLYALNIETGKKIWNFDTKWGINRPPVIFGKVAYIVDHLENVLHPGGNLYAVDIVTGEEIWRIGIDSGSPTLPIIVDGILHFGEDPGLVRVVDSDTGKQIWRHKGTGLVRALDLDTRAEKWNIKIDTGISSTPAVDEGIILWCGDLSTWGGHGHGGKYLLAFDIKEGTEKWRFWIGNTQSLSNRPPPSFFIPASPAVANKTVFLGSNEIYGRHPWEGPNIGHLHAIDIDTGLEIWRVDIQDAITSPPAFAHGKIFLAGHSECLYAIGVQERKVKWRFQTQGEIISSPSIAGGIVYFGGKDGFLYAVDIDTGTEIWKFKTGESIWDSPTIANGVIYICSNDGCLYAIE